MGKPGDEAIHVLMFINCIIALQYMDSQPLIMKANKEVVPCTHVQNKSIRLHFRGNLSEYSSSSLGRAIALFSQNCLSGPPHTALHCAMRHLQL